MGDAKGDLPHVVAEEAMWPRRQRLEVKCHIHSKGSQPPREGEQSLPRTSREPSPADTLISTQWDWFQTSGLQNSENKFLVFWATKFVMLYDSSLYGGRWRLHFCLSNPAKVAFLSSSNLKPHRKVDCRECKLIWSVSQHRSSLRFPNKDLGGLEQLLCNQKPFKLNKTNL